MMIPLKPKRYCAETVMPPLEGTPEVFPRNSDCSSCTNWSLSTAMTDLRLDAA